MMNLCLEVGTFPVAALGYRNEIKETASVSLLRRELSKAVLATDHLDEWRKQTESLDVVQVFEIFRMAIS